MRSYRILILGGTGFVGTALTYRLLRLGHSVRLPSRFPQRHAALGLHPGAELLAADVHRPDALLRLCAGMDIAINLVGILHEQGEDGRDFQRVHTALTEQLVTACRACGVQRLLQMSALQAATTAPSHYLRSKGAAEAALHEATDLAWTIFRPSVIFGAQDSLTRRFATLLRWLPVLPLARADAQFAPVWVEDVVSAFVAALDLPAARQQTYELGGPEVMSLAELVRRVAASIGVRRLVFGLPDWAGQLQAMLFERLPGKLLTVDNFRSLSLPSVPATNGLAALGIQAEPIGRLLDRQRPA